MRVSPPLKRIMITKSIRIREELVARMEEQLWNHKFEGIPHGRQAEFFDRAVTKELERLEGKNIETALDELSNAYAELASCIRVTGKDLKAIEMTIAVLKDIVQSKEGEEIATIK